jgi:hypothetical protein
MSTQVIKLLLPMTETRICALNFYYFLAIFFQEIEMSHISQKSFIDFTKLLSVAAAVISSICTLSISIALL